MVGEKTYSGCHENIGITLLTGPGYLKMEVYGISILRLILSFSPFTLQTDLSRVKNQPKYNYVYILEFSQIYAASSASCCRQLPLHFGRTFHKFQQYTKG